jgi:hypothetical protein
VGRSDAWRHRSSERFWIILGPVCTRRSRADGQLDHAAGGLGMPSLRRSWLEVHHPPNRSADGGAVVPGRACSCSPLLHGLQWARHGGAGLVSRHRGGCRRPRMPARLGALSTLLGGPVTPRPGDVLIVDKHASVQFAAGRGLVFRVISVSRQPTYVGWTWLTGYVLDEAGNAIERREIFVRTDGLRSVRPGGPRTGNSRWPSF